MIRDALSRLVRAWLVTAIVDALFSSALAVFAYRSTVTRLWQGVASILLGPAAFEGERGRPSSDCCCIVASRSAGPPRSSRSTCHGRSSVARWPRSGA